VLTPGRYVGAEAAEDDGEPFGKKMQRLTATLREQQQKIIEEWGEGVSMLVAAQQQPIQQVQPKKGRARR